MEKLQPCGSVNPRDPVLLGMDINKLDKRRRLREIMAKSRITGDRRRCVCFIQSIVRDLAGERRLNISVPVASAESSADSTSMFHIASEGGGERKGHRHVDRGIQYACNTSSAQVSCMAFTLPDEAVHAAENKPAAAALVFSPQSWILRKLFGCFSRE